MPRKNEYTFVIERPMSREAAARNAKLLTELGLERRGYTAKITARELRPGEKPCPIRLPGGIQTVG